MSQIYVDGFHEVSASSFMDVKGNPQALGIDEKKNKKTKATVKDHNQRQVYVGLWYALKQTNMFAYGSGNVSGKFDLVLPNIPTPLHLKKYKMTDSEQGTNRICPSCQGMVGNTYECKDCHTPISYNGWTNAFIIEKEVVPIAKEQLDSIKELQTKKYIIFPVEEQGEKYLAYVECYHHDLMRMLKDEPQLNIIEEEGKVIEKSRLESAVQYVKSVEPQKDQYAYESITNEKKWEYIQKYQNGEVSPMVEIIKPTEELQAVDVDVFGMAIQKKKKAVKVEV